MLNNAKAFIYSRAALYLMDIKWDKNKQFSYTGRTSLRKTSNNCLNVTKYSVQCEEQTENGVAWVEKRETVLTIVLLNMRGWSRQIERDNMQYWRYVNETQKFERDGSDQSDDREVCWGWRCRVQVILSRCLSMLYNFITNLMLSAVNSDEVLR